MIQGGLGKWRACFSRARAANVFRRRDLVDADIVHLAGLHTLDMSWCSQPTITDAAFAHLCGTHTLDMTLCNQPTITGGAFAYLQGIHASLHVGLQGWSHHCSQGAWTSCLRLSASNWPAEPPPALHPLHHSVSACQCHTLNTKNMRTPKRTPRFTVKTQLP